MANTKMTDQYFTDLLKTKIFIPPLRDGLIPRPRLVQKLNGGLKKKLILVEAPAGYGKTTLIAEWMAQTNKRHSIYSIDQNDNDLSRFLTYIIYSLKQIEPDLFDKVLSLIHSPEANPTHIILASLLNDLSSIKLLTTLVIDDYHLIQLSEIHEALSFILQNLPPNLQIILVSRKELPFSISILRARNQILELNIFDLRFTKEEIRAFVKEILNLDFSVKELDELDRKTEGWVTSLQLALMGTKWKDNTERFQQLSGNDRFIAEYLYDEVIAKQSEEIQDFLLKTSVLDRFCAPLCDDLLESKNSLAIIRHLEQSNLFIIPLDNLQLWYRYHHLFVEFLQNRLFTNKSSVMSDLFKKASKWYEVNGNKEMAIEYALKAEDFVRSTELIQPVIADILSKGGRERVIHWLSKFPLKILRQNHSLWSYLVLANLDLGAFGEAYKVLDNLWGKEEYIDSVPLHEQPFVKGLRAGFLASITIHTTLHAVVAKGLAQQSIDYIPHDATFGRCIGFGHFGTASLIMGEIPQARHFLERAIAESKKESYERLFFLWTCYRTTVEIEAGNLHQAKDMIVSVLRFAEARGVRQSHVTMNAVLGLGRIMYEWNNLQEAQKFLDEAVTTTEAGEYLDHLMLGYQHYFRYLMVHKDFETARQKIIHARKIASIYDKPEIVVGRINALETMVDIKAGSVIDELVLDKRFNGWSDYEIDGLNEFKLYMLAQVWIQAGKFNESIYLLNKLSDNAAANERKNSSMHIGVTLAKAHFLNGSTSKAKIILAATLEMGRPEGYVRTFLDAGEPILILTRTILAEFENAANLKSPALIGYVKHIISEFAQEAKRVGKLDKIEILENKFQGLTTRENEVVALLEIGLSYFEIAQRLVITENTLKTHIKHIYCKLDVRNRTEAVRKLKRSNAK